MTSTQAHNAALTGRNSFFSAAALIPALLIVLFTVVLGHRMTLLCDNGLGRSTTDMASINQAVWNTAHGRILQATILYEGVRDHFEPVLLLYSINYVLGGTIHSLLYLHALLIALGAIPFYLAARKRNGSLFEATLAALAYLLFPALHQMVDTNYLRPDLIFLPAISLMAYAVTFWNVRLVVLSVILSLACKESGGLAVFGLGLYCLAFRREFRLGAALAVVGLAWMPLVSRVLLPYAMDFTPRHGGRFRAMSTGQFTDLCRVGWPIVTLLFTAILLLRRRWASLITMPQTLGLFFFVARLRYFTATLPIPLFLTFDELSLLPNTRLRRALLCALPAIFLLVNIQMGLWRNIEQNADIAVAMRLAENIPQDASVCADDALLVHLSTRARLYAFNRRHYHPVNGRDYLDADYFLIRLEKEEHKPGSVRRHKKYSRAIAEMNSLRLEKIAEATPFTLYRNTLSAMN